MSIVDGHISHLTTVNSLVEFGGAEEPAYTWDHYIAFHDVPDWDDKVFANKAEWVMAELWVSHPSTTLLNTSYTLYILEIMTGYITSLCKISSDARRDMRLGQLMWLTKPVINS